eukprot:g5015.t1
MQSLYQRSWERNLYTPTSSSVSFRVAQFNVLAEGLSSARSARPPFPSFRERPSDCGGFDKIARPDVVFNFSDVRRWGLVEEIISIAPDILCLEEVDCFFDFMEPALASLGMRGAFQPKRRSPSLQYGYCSDGVSIMWKDELFEEVILDEDAERERARQRKCEQFEAAAVAASVASEDHDVLPDAPGGRTRTRDGTRCVFLVKTLRHRPTGHLVVVGATHLKSKPTRQFERRRLQQITGMLETMAEEEARARSRFPRTRVHIVLCGDFNADPFVVQERKTGKSLSPLAVNAVLSSGRFRSAYPLPKSASEGKWTTWKLRGEHESKHVIDYIFHGTDGRVLATLNLPVITEISRLPGERYPSDHCAIAADLCFEGE